MPVNDDRQLIGGEEWCALPELGLPWVKSRVDSGARTSSLHAWNIHRFSRDGADWVSFRVHPLQRDRRTVVRCEAPLVDHRGVKSSSGATEARYVIRTTLVLAGQRFEVELTLTSRDSMGFRMLLGREAMAERLIVDPSTSFRGQVPAGGELDAAYAPHRVVAPHLDIGVLADRGRKPILDALHQAAASRGHSLRVVDPSACRVRFEGAREIVEGADVPEPGSFDAIVALCSRPNAATAGLLLRHFEHLGAYSPNPARAVLEASDRAVAYQRLARSGVRLPDAGWSAGGRTEPVGDASRYLVRGAGDDDGRIVSAGATGLEDTTGRGVLVQSLPGTGELVRCFVAGTRVLVTPLAPGDGGILSRPRGRAPRLQRASRRDIRRAVRALGVTLARVDALIDDDQPIILDVDPFAFASAAGKSAATCADALLAHVERAMGSAARHAG